MMIKKETFNYNLLTQTPDKIFYIIKMNLVSIGFAIGVIMLWFFIDRMLVSFAGFSYIDIINNINIGIIICSIILLPIILGVDVLKVFKNILYIIYFCFCYMFIFAWKNFKFSMGVAISNFWKSYNDCSKYFTIV